MRAPVGTGDRTMGKPKNETTSARAATIAGHVLSTGRATTAEAMTIAAALLTQAPNKPIPAPRPAPKPPKPKK